MACDFDGSNWMRQVVPHSASASIPVWSVLQLVAAWLTEGDEDKQRRVVSIGNWDSTRW